MSREASPPMTWTRPNRSRWTVTPSLHRYALRMVRVIANVGPHHDRAGQVPRFLSLRSSLVRTRGTAGLRHGLQLLAVPPYRGSVARCRRIQLSYHLRGERASAVSVQYDDGQALLLQALWRASILAATPRSDQMGGQRPLHWRRRSLGSSDEALRWRELGRSGKSSLCTAQVAKYGLSARRTRTRA